MATITVDIRELSAFARHLAGIDPKLRVLLRREMVNAGQGAADAVKKEADWSTRIPGAVRTKVSFAKRGTGVAVVVDRRKAPEARPLEHGGRAGEFRHPVFADAEKERGEWTWVNQDARPFFEKASTAYELGAFQARVEAIGTEVSVMVVGLT